MSGIGTWKLMADLDGNGVWEQDWSAYLMGAQVTQGRQHSLDQMGGMSATFTLNNADGRFSPDNGTLAIDHFAPITLYDDVSDLYLFTGYITGLSFEPEAGSMRAVISAEDIINLSSGIIIDMGLIDGRTADLALHRVLDLVERGDIVSNPGAEVDLTNWEKITAGDAVTRETTAANVFEGVGCVKVVTANSATGEGVSYELYDDGHTSVGNYTCGFFINAPVDATLRVLMWSDYGGGTYQSAAITHIVGTGDWQHVQASSCFLFSSQAPVASHQVRIETETTTQDITFYVDSLHLAPNTSRIVRAMETGQTALSCVSFSQVSGLEALRKIADSEPGQFWSSGEGYFYFKAFAGWNTLAIPVAVNTDNGYLRKNDADYATARAETATVYTGVNAAWCEVGQLLSGGIYTIYRSYFRFDTSGLGAGAEVLSASLRVYVGLDYTTTNFAGKVRKKTWGAALEAADWSATPSSDTLMGTFDTSATGWSTGWQSIELTTSTIETEAYTDLYLISDEDDDDPGSAPTGAEHFLIEGEYNVGTHPAYLLITYTPAPTPEVTFSDDGTHQDYHGLRVHYDAADRISAVRINCLSDTETAAAACVLWRSGATWVIGAGTAPGFRANCTTDVTGSVSIEALPAQASCTATITKQTGSSISFRLTNAGGSPWTVTSVTVTGTPRISQQGPEEAVYTYEPTTALQWIDQELQVDMPFALPTSDIVASVATGMGDKYSGRVLRADLSVLPISDAELATLIALGPRDLVRLENVTGAYALGINKLAYVEGRSIDITLGPFVTFTYHLEEV